MALLAALPALLAVVFAALAWVWADASEDIGARRNRLIGVAGMTAAAAAEAVARNDRPRVQATLESILRVPGVSYARIERPDGAIMVEVASSAAARAEGRVAADVARPVHGVEWEGRTAQVSTPITFGGRSVGQVVVLTHSEGAADGLAAALGLALSAAAPAVLLGVVAAWSFRRRLGRLFSELLGRIGMGGDEGESAELEALVRGVERLAHVHAHTRARAAALEAEVRGRAAATARAEATASSKTRLIGALSHELKPALAGVEDLADALVGGGPALRQRRLAQTAARAGTVMAATVDDFLTLAGVSPPPPGPTPKGVIDLLEAAEDTVELFWRRAAEQKVDLAAYVDPVLPRAITGDQARLRRVIAGLVDLALRSCRTGGVVVEAEPDAPGWLRVSVRIAGEPVPLPPGDPAPVLCRRLAETMGGALQFTGGRDKPLVSVLRLPLQAKAPAADWPTAPVKGAAAQLAHQGVATRRALARYLAKAGYQLELEDDGGPPALIAIDTEGLDPDRKSNIPTVCVGELSEVQSLVRAGAAHAGLCQPFRRMELESLLRSLSAGRPLADPADPARTADGADAGPDMEVEALLADLDQAIARNELSLVYQPQFDRDGRNILGVESLIRWSHPRRGLVPPSLFIPLAEKHGRIEPLTNWVIDRALIETAGFAGLQVAMNVSAVEFGKPGVVDRILGLIDKHGAEPTRLEVEITETAILDAEEQVKKNMAALRARGVKMSLDDFGAGHSSLGHLRRYPFDKLKIDREFVTDCTGDVQSATVVHAVVSIGRALGMQVVAEGVETEAQRQFLKVAGVHAMQGYLFGRPMTAAALGALLAEHSDEAQKKRA